MKVYTTTGDQGHTSLVGGTRVEKDDVRVEAYGTVDELCSFIAYLGDNYDVGDLTLDEFRDDILTIQNTLMDIQAILAGAGIETTKLPRVTGESITYLEERIDYLQQQVPEIDRFTIPGGYPLNSLSHICRTVCRRAERRAVTASKQYQFQPEVISYLNRLSDYFYLLGRRFAEEFNADEKYWAPEK